MEIKIDFDLAKLKITQKDIDPNNEIATQVTEGLRDQVQKHIYELAAQRLRSTRAKFLAGLHVKVGDDKQNPSIDVDLDDDVSWIEKGAPKIDLKNHMLQGREKVVIPFNHGKGPSKTRFADMNATKEKLYMESTSAMRKSGMGVSKVNNDQFGKPIIGHVGSIKSVHSSIKSKHSGESVLNRLKVSQVKGAKGGIRKEMTTFRTMTKDQPSDMWVIPAAKPHNIIKDTESWVDQNYNNIIDDIAKKIFK